MVFDAECKDLLRKIEHMVERASRNTTDPDIITAKILIELLADKVFEAEKAAGGDTDDL